VIEVSHLFIRIGPQKNGIRDGANFNAVWVKQSPDDITMKKGLTKTRGTPQGDMRSFSVQFGVFNEKDGERFFVGFTNHNFVGGVSGVMRFDPFAVSFPRNLGWKDDVVIVADTLPGSRPDREQRVNPRIVH
jgi:hypothetical protein